MLKAEHLLSEASVLLDGLAADLDGTPVPEGQAGLKADEVLQQSHDETYTVMVRLANLRTRLEDHDKKVEVFS